MGVSKDSFLSLLSLPFSVLRDKVGVVMVYVGWKKCCRWRGTIIVSMKWVEVVGGFFRLFVLKNYKKIGNFHLWSRPPPFVVWGEKFHCTPLMMLKVESVLLFTAEKWDGEYGV